MMMRRKSAALAILLTTIFLTAGGFAFTLTWTTQADFDAGAKNNVLITADGNVSLYFNRIILNSFNNLHNASVTKDITDVSGNFVLDFEINVTGVGGTDGNIAFWVGLGDASASNSPRIGISFYRSGTGFTMQAMSNPPDQGTAQFGSLSANTKYYIRLQRSGSTVTGTAYSDAARTSSVTSDSFSSSLSQTLTHAVFVSNHKGAAHGGVLSAILENYTNAYDLSGTLNETDDGDNHILLPTFGNLASNVSDSGNSTNWAQLIWSAATPSGTNISFQVRANDTAFNKTSPEFAPDNSTVALWHLNEGSGTTYTDSSGNGEHLTLANNAGWTSQANAKFGGAAANFPAVTDYASRSISTTMRSVFESGNYTVEGWVYIDEANHSTYRAIYGITGGSHAGEQTAVYVTASGLLEVTVRGGSAHITGSTVVPLRTWFHFAVVSGATSSTLFLNGVSEGSTGSLTIGTSATTFFINKWLVNGLPGRIDEIRISNRVRTAAEIAEAVAGGPSWINAGNTSPANLTASNVTGRYFQWLATLTTTDATQSPVLQEVNVSTAVAVPPAPVGAITIQNITQTSDHPIENESFTVRTNITSTGGNITNATLFYSTNSSTFANTSMSNYSGLWNATISGQLEGTTTDYYIRAFDTAGNNATSATIGTRVFGLNISLSVPELVARSENATVSGTLRYSDGAAANGRTVNITFRNSTNATVATASTTVAADGSFNATQTVTAAFDVFKVKAQSHLAAAERQAAIGAILAFGAPIPTKRTVIITKSPIVILDRFGRTTQGFLRVGVWSGR